MYEEQNFGKNRTILYNNASSVSEVYYLSF